jgi:3-oxoadipate enol-lactonase
MTRHHVEVGGRRLAWRQAGQGEPVVLLHAFPMSSDMWLRQLDAVPHGFQLIAPDLRGFGQSVGPPARSVDDHAEDVLALLRHLNIERAVIGGLSMGGYVTFALHRLAAQRFRAIILADTRAEADSPEARAGRDQMTENVRAHGAPAAAEAMLPKLLRPRALTDPALAGVREATRDIILGNSPAAILDAIEALKTRPDSTSTLAQITAPTLILIGAEDQTTPLPLSESMHAQVRSSSLVVIPDAGHAANLDQPEAFNAALWKFVGRL